MDLFDEGFLAAMHSVGIGAAALGFFTFLTRIFLGWRTGLPGSHLRVRYRLSFP